MTQSEYPDRYEESLANNTNTCCLTCQDIDENFKEEHTDDYGNCLCYNCCCRKCLWYDNGRCSK
jgi:hypothetical protein